MARPPASSPDGAGFGGPAPEGEAKVARLVLSPPGAPAARPLPGCEARSLLNRLRRPLRRDGWVVERHYDDEPVRLRVYSAAAPCFGESIMAVETEAGYWYVSSAYSLLAPCEGVDLAVREVGALLLPILRATVSHPADAR